MPKIDFPFNNVGPSAAPGSLLSNSNLKIGDIIGALLPYLFTGAGLLLLIYLIIGGLQMMTSGGDPKAVESAKGKITGALIGFVIVFVAYWLVQIVASVLGLQTSVGKIFGIQ